MCREHSGSLRQGGVGAPLEQVMPAQGLLEQDKSTLIHKEAAR